MVIVLCFFLSFFCWLLFCASFLASFLFFFLVLRGVVSSFLVLFWSSVFVFFFLVFLSSFYSFLSGELLFNKRASVTSFLLVILVGVFCFFLELLCLDLLSCCVRAWFFRWWEGLADLLQSGLLFEDCGFSFLARRLPCGGSGFIRKLTCWLYSYGVSLP